EPMARRAIIATAMTPSFARLHNAAVATALALLVCAVAAFAQQATWETGSDGLAPIPKLTARLTDQTNTLSSSERQALEAVLADAMSRRIIADDVAPLFRQNRFAAGISAGVDRIIAVVGSGEPLPARRAAPVRHQTSFDWPTLLILLFVGVPIVGGVLSR